jgi:RHH-type proline utilization regulon transcriptional repressor/proline dehydrogenase/delta 1-pyrroline-5-carboxylate dehydrogenase
VAAAAGRAEAAFEAWAATDVTLRASYLERAADLMQERMPSLIGLVMREAGKSAPNAIAEVREAIDFLRYYASEARRTLNAATPPLGVVTCISPWNFPLAIFIGQIAAALAAGNSVLAKPAEETPLVAAEGVKLLHAAGIPADVLQLLPGDGSVGAALVACPVTAGVMFTGSTEVAKQIQATLARRVSRWGTPIPLVAETGGQNAMIVDSSALAEQVVADVVASAFDSAGQRCSALRVLCLQDDIADRQLAMLKGALKELVIGRTDRLAVDIGPVITAEARAGIEAHIDRMRAAGCAIERLALPPEARHGMFVAPTIIEIDSISQIGREVFGPVLHVLRFRRDQIQRVIDDINATGYGLTFGLHTRLDETIADVTAHAGAGNIYVNRNIIGAVVGVQPFGGHGLSGTGPKAGGPLYLGRLVRTMPGTGLAGSANSNTALAELAAWLHGKGDSARAERARKSAKSALAGHVSELAGPVGERNLYALRPRANLLLMPLSAGGLADQLIAMLASGGSCTIAGAGALRAGFSDLPDAVAGRIEWIDTLPATGAYSAALIEPRDDGLEDVLGAIAAMAGPIPLQQIGNRDGSYRQDWLVEEVSTSINTTAAGGNATLMAMV